MSVFHENYTSLRNLLAINQHPFASLLPSNVQNVVCMAGSSSGDNYMSIVKRIQVNAPTSTAENNYVSMIIKRQVSHPQRRELFRFVEIFSNEIHAYNVIVPYIQKYIHTPQDGIFPHCYYAGTDNANELIIILEDLKEIGFDLFNRQIDMDLNICKAVVKQLARLHAASLVARVMDNAGFQRLRENLYDVVYSKKAEALYSKLLRKSSAIALFSLELSNTDGSLNEPIGQLEQLHGKVFKCMRECVLRADAVHSVICHGDLWVNNIMVNGSIEPPGIKFVDLQAVRYGSPVFDILHVIYTGTCRELRDKHTDAILETYCKTLANILEKMIPSGSENALKALKDSYSLRNIKDQYYRSLVYGLGVTMWILPACTFDPKNLPNLDNISGSPEMMNDAQSDEKFLEAIQEKLTDRFHVRMKETVLEFHENGFLKNLIDDLEKLDEFNTNEKFNNSVSKEEIKLLNGKQNGSV